MIFCKAMQINNRVGTHAFVGALGNLWQVFFIHEDANDALLAVAIGNLVADLRHAHRAQAYADLQKAIAIHHDGNLINDKRFRVFADDNNRAIAAHFAAGIVGRLEDAPDEDVIIFDSSAFGGKTFEIDFGLVGFAANADAGHA